MIKKILLTMIIMLVVNLAFAPSALAAGNPEKEAKFAEKVRTEIAKLGVGTDVLIKVKLKDDTKIKGYLSETNGKDFSVTDPATGKITVVAYSNAKQVKGNNLSTETVITIAVVSAILIIGLIVAYSAQ